MKQVVQHEYRAGAESHWWMRARRSIFRRILREYVKPPDGAHVLDVGPGFGVNTEVLAECGSVSVLDTSIESLTDCRRRGAARSVCGDAQAPPLRAGVVDLVCALDVLEHLDEDTLALTSWHELLRDDGRLLLTVPALPLLWGHHHGVRCRAVAPIHCSQRRPERSVRAAELQLQYVVGRGQRLGPTTAGQRPDQYPPNRRSRHPPIVSATGPSNNEETWLCGEHPLTPRAVGQLRRVLLSALPKVLLSRTTRVLTHILYGGQAAWWWAARGWVVR